LDGFAVPNRKSAVSTIIVRGWCSQSALAVLEAVKLSKTAPDALVFPGAQPFKPLTDVTLSKALHVPAGTKDVTVRGLRFTFRDWAWENTDYPGDVAETALAHAIGSKVEAAYRRGDLFEKRQEMMEAWEAVARSLF
jgi:integrase